MLTDSTVFVHPWAVKRSTPSGNWVLAGAFGGAVAASPMASDVTEQPGGNGVAPPAPAALIATWAVPPTLPGGNGTGVDAIGGACSGIGPAWPTTGQPGLATRVTPPVVAVALPWLAHSWANSTRPLSIFSCAPAAICTSRAACSAPPSSV